MLKRILLLGRVHAIQKERSSDLYEKLKEHLPGDFELTTVNYKDLIIDAVTGKVSIMIAKTGEDISSYDFVYMMSWYSYIPTRREMAFAIAHYLDWKNIPFVNSEALHSRSSSKISQMVIFALHGLAIPRTVFGLSKEGVVSYVKSQPELASGPLVVKDALASRGANNFLCKNANGLEALPIGQKEAAPYLVQEHIPNDGKDWRVLIMGFKAKLLLERRASNESHLNNTSQGGTASLLPFDTLPEEVLEHAVKVAKLLHRDVTGVDVMHNTRSDTYVFLEANALPQLATGAFVDEKVAALAEAIVARVKGDTE